jgi:hypothetical protein
VGVDRGDYGEGGGIVISIPKYAQENAAMGLRMRKEFPQGDRPGFNRDEAEESGTHSGVREARNLKDGGRLTERRAKRIRSTLARHVGQADGNPSDKQRAVINLWGGERFLDYLERKLD